MAIGRRDVLCGCSCAWLAAAAGRITPAVANVPGSYRLEFVGSFAATTRHGAVAARIRADAPPERGSWAVGPTEGLAGELTVLDGRAFVATVRHREVRVVEDRSAGAPFLVWAEVAGWREHALPPGLADARALEAHLQAIARDAALPPEGPFPFLLVGRPEEVTWHALGGPGAGPHGGGHGQAVDKRVLRGRSMTLIGFYSRRHEDVFTHRGEFSHIHFVTDDRALLGHVDALVPGVGLTLKLPA